MNESSGDNEHLNIPLKEGLSISDLIKDGTTFEVNFDRDSEPEQLAYQPEDSYKYTNPALTITDEDTYQEEPFETISRLMINVTPDGKIKKRVIREGYGNAMPHMATVTVDYNGYLEYHDEPFDSTYIRKRPVTFRLNAGETIIGLDMAVQSMKINEKAQFLIEPDYAYGTLGCLERVPPNSTCLFEIEVKNVVDSGATYTFNNLTESEQNDFEEIYKYANALCMKAKELCKKGAWKPAIKEYNIAVSKLETCLLRDSVDEEKQQKLLLRLYTNLAVVYTKLQEPRRGCTSCNKAFNMCKGTTLQPSAKLYFNNARCLVLLGDYAQAERQLKMARTLDPLNIEISNQLKKLENEKKKNCEQEVAVAKAYFNTKTNKTNEPEITKEFQDTMKRYCQQLLRDSNAKQYALPDVLSEVELQFVTSEVQKHGLKLEHTKTNDGTTKYSIVKYDVESLANKINRLTMK